MRKCEEIAPTAANKNPNSYLKKIAHSNAAKMPQCLRHSQRWMASAGLNSFPTAHMFNFTQLQALFVPYLPSKAKPTLVGMNTEVTLRKSNIIWTAVDSLLFIRNFNKGQRKKQQLSIERVLP